MDVDPRDAFEVLREAPVDLDGMDVRDASGQKPGQDAEPGPNLEDDIGRVQRGEALDHTEDVLVDEEVLAQRLARDDGHSPKTAAAFASICAASSAGSTARAWASADSVCIT